MPTTNSLIESGNREITTKVVPFDRELIGGNYWLSRGALNTARTQEASFSLGGFVFATAGFNTASSTVHESYNDSSNAWTTKTAFSLTASKGLMGFGLSLGYVGYGTTGSDVATMAAYNESANTWTTKTSGNTARHNVAATDLNGYGYVVQGIVSTTVSNVNEQYNEATDTWTTKAASTTSADENTVVSAGGRIISVYGETTPGSVTTATSLQYSDVSNAWSTISSSSGTSRSGASGFNANGIVNVATGRQNNLSTNFTDNDRLDLGLNNWSVKAPNPTALSLGIGGSMNGNGYVIGGQTGSGNGITTTTQYRNYHMYQVTMPLKRSPQAPSFIMTSVSIDGTPYNLPVQLRTDGTNWKFQMSGLVTATKTGEVVSTVYAATGGYRNYEIQIGLPKFISGLGGGFWLTRTAGTAKDRSTGLSLNGLGYSIAGRDATPTRTSSTHQYNDYSDSWTAKGSISGIKQLLASFDLNGLGYAAGGSAADGAVVATNDQYNDETDVWSAKTAISTGREALAGYSLGGLGYMVGGASADSAGSPTTISTVNEQHNDSTNAWTAKAVMTTGRKFLGAFGINQMGYTCTGDTSSTTSNTASAVIEQYNDAADSWAAKASVTTAIFGAFAFAVGNKGYLAYGSTGSLVTTLQQYDDLLNLWSIKSSATGTARQNGSSFSIKSSGYTACGNSGSASNELNQYIINERFSQIQITLDTVAIP